MPMTSPRQYGEQLWRFATEPRRDARTRSSGAHWTRHAGDNAVPALVAPRRRGSRSGEPLLQDLQRSNLIEVGPAPAERLSRAAGAAHLVEEQPPPSVDHAVVVRLGDPLAPRQDEAHQVVAADRGAQRAFR